MLAIWLTLWSSRSQVYVAGLRLSPMAQSVQDLDVGQLGLFLRCLNVKCARRLENFTNASHSRMSAMFVFHNPVLSLARPNFLGDHRNSVPGRYIAKMFTPVSLDRLIFLCVA